MLLGASWEYFDLFCERFWLKSGTGEHVMFDAPSTQKYVFLNSEVTNVGWVDRCLRRHPSVDASQIYGRIA